MNRLIHACAFALAGTALATGAQATILAVGNQVLDSGSGLTTVVAGDAGLVPVFLHSSWAASQYGATWGTESGIVNPDLSKYAGAYYRNGQRIENPYLTEAGALKIGGYLMVKGVPEPSTYVLVAIGLAASAVVARRGGARRVPGSRTQS